MEKETIAQEALRLLSPIPKEDFITHDFTNGENKCCVIGHYQRLKSKNPLDYALKNCADIDWDKLKNISQLRIKSRAYLNSIHNIDKDISEVNNNNVVNGYNEPEIKDRVIHLLNDMIAAGY